MKGTGILLNDEYDLQVLPVRDANNKIVSGLVIGNTLYQNQAVILMAQPGEIKEMPVLGVGINDVVLDTDFLSWRRRIRQHMELDGQTVNEVKFDLNKNLVIDAGY
ncbi:MAG: hypothetical protein JWP81_6 [Ferruginibacter sp.]|nr:hypothetical protein [Ferruginibacter sp.]